MSRSRLFCPTTLLAFALLHGVLPVACNRDPGARKQKFYTNAIELLKKGQGKRAELELRNALEIDPNFVEADNLLAELLAQRGEYREASTLLRQAVAAKPEYLPAHKGLSQLYRFAGKFAEAESEAAYILERSPADVDALLSLGTAQQGQRKWKEAEGAFSRVLTIQPGQVDALLALAALRQEAHDLKGAEGFLSLAREDNPSSAAVLIALVKFYVATGRPAEAEPLFADALRVSGDNIAILQAQADYYISLGELAKAEEAAKRIRSARANDPKYSGVLADFYIQTGDWYKAKAELESALQGHKEDPGLVHKLIEVHLRLNDSKTAETLNEALLKKSPKDSYGHLIKGRLFVERGDVENALAQFNETHQYQPTLPSLYYWYARAYLQKGNLGQAQRSLGTALELEPNYREARLQLAEIQNRTNAWDAAMSNARVLLQRDPRDVEAMLVYSQSLLLQKDFAQAEKVLKAALQQAPKNAEAHVQWGIVSLANNNLPGARQEFMEAWNLQPGSKPLLENVLMGFVSLKQMDAAVDFLQKAIHDRPQIGLLYHELAQIYLLQNKRALAVSALQKALQMTPASADSAILLADIYATEKQPEATLRVLAEIARQDPMNADLMVRSGMILEKIQLWNDARTSYERALQLDNANAVAKNNLAWLLVEHGDDIDRALKLAQEAKERLPDNVRVTSTIGWIYYKKGIYSAARNYLKECADKEPNNAVYQFQLGMVYSRLGNRDDARRALLNALTLDPHSAEGQAASRALAQLPLRNF